jgi:hypothetical protein
VRLPRPRDHPAPIASCTCDGSRCGSHS